MAFATSPTLFTIPAEIRFSIYRLLYPTQTFVITPRVEASDPSDWVLLLGEARSLFNTCKLLRDEASDVLFPTASFIYQRYQDVPPQRRQPQTSFKTLPVVRQHVRRLLSLNPELLHNQCDNVEDIKTWFPNLEFLTIRCGSPFPWQIFVQRFQEITFETAWEDVDEDFEAWMTGKSSAEASTSSMTSDAENEGGTKRLEIYVRVSYYLFPMYNQRMFVLDLPRRKLMHEVDLQTPANQHLIDMFPVPG